MAAQGARPGDVEDSAHDAIANMLEGDVSAIRNPRAYLHRSVHHGLISRHHRQQREAAVPLHWPRTSIPPTRIPRPTCAPPSCRAR